MAGSRKVPDGCPLSPRRFEVLQLLGEGRTTKEIAAGLGITASTVRSLAHDINRTLGCTNAKQAIAAAGRRGWMGWEPPEEATPLAVTHPFLAAYLQEFERSRWPNEPAPRSVLGMRLALAGHINSTTD